MTYSITGSVTFQNQSQRDAAMTRVGTAMSGFTYVNATTSLPAGINTSGTTIITISIEDGDDGVTAKTMADALFNALVQTNRHTSGWVSVNFI